MRSGTAAPEEAGAELSPTATPAPSSLTGSATTALCRTARWEPRRAGADGKCSPAPRGGWRRAAEGRAVPRQAVGGRCYSDWLY